MVANKCSNMNARDVSLLKENANTKGVLATKCVPDGWPMKRLSTFYSWRSIDPVLGTRPQWWKTLAFSGGGVIYVLEELSYRYPRLFAVHSWFIWCKTWAVIGLMLFFFFQTATRWRQTQCISTVTLVVTRRIYNRYQWVLLYCRSPDVDATLVAILC